MLFDGIAYGNTAPTDLDGFYDLRGRGCIVFELKYKDKYCPQGQRIAMEYIINCMRDLKKPSIAIIAEHHVINPNEDVFVKDAIVREHLITTKNEWVVHENEISLVNFIDLFIENYHQEFIKSMKGK